MTDFNQKTHDTDVGSYGGQSRQMTEVFENQEFGSIRLFQEAGKTFFCASDVAKALGYVNPYAAVRRHCRGPLTKREGVVQKVNQYGDAGEQVVEIAFITEGDVYRLIVHSKLPSAERFEHWVFDEVLPSIRKHGVYMSDSILDQVIQHPEVIYTLAQELVAEREQLEGIRKQLDAAQPKADYVTEGTFDAYLYQTLENKQKFISQIMTSKSPVRSCDDVDEQALSYAEIKALCAGDPQIKEKMDLDVDVARLKVLKADHQSQQYRLEDKLMKYFPAEIEKTQGFIKGFQSDIRTVAAHPLPEEGFCGMEVNDTRFTEKAEAGEAILAICKTNQSLEPVPLGSYRGFKMELSFDSFQKEYQVLLKGEMTHRVPIGTSAAGNIQRLDNALAGIPARLEKTEQQLDNLRSQQEAAQAELGKPFPQEAELAEKSARLAELDALLNMDDRGNDDPDREKTTEKPSVLAELRDRAGRIPPMAHRDDEEVAL